VQSNKYDGTFSVDKVACGASQDGAGLPQSSRVQHVARSRFQYAVERILAGWAVNGSSLSYHDDCRMPMPVGLATQTFSAFVQCSGFLCGKTVKFPATKNFDFGGKVEID
jgi:hypothetical protein